MSSRDDSAASMTMASQKKTCFLEEDLQSQDLRSRITKRRRQMFKKSGTCEEQKEKFFEEEPPSRPRIRQKSAVNRNSKERLKQKTSPSKPMTLWSLTCKLQNKRSRQERKDLTMQTEVRLRKPRPLSNDQNSHSPPQACRQSIV